MAKTRYGYESLRPGATLETDSRIVGNIGRYHAAGKVNVTLDGSEPKGQQVTYRELVTIGRFKPIELRNVRDAAVIEAYRQKRWDVVYS